MKSFLIFVSVVLTVFALSSVSFATNPSAMTVKYDSSKGELNVVVQHNVTDRLAHFISEVDVFKNGSEVVKKEFDFQTSKRNQTMIPIKVDAKTGDSLNVVAICNEGGRFEKNISISTPK